MHVSGYAVVIVNGSGQCLSNFRLTADADFSCVIGLRLRLGIRVRLRIRIGLGVRLRRRCHVITVMVFIVVVCGDGNAALRQCYTADDADGRRRWQAAACCRPCADFACQDVFRGVIHYRVDVWRTVGLYANQRALAVGKVIFDDQAVVIVNAHHEVIAAACATDRRRAASASFGKFVVDVVHRFDL